MTKKAIIGTLLPLLLVLFFVGCQDLFTYSPLEFAQRDPADLPLDQQINNAEDALASGDPKEMTEAYNAIKQEAATSTDPELNHLGANLATELSGVPELVFEVLENQDFITSDFQGSLDTFTESINTTYAVEAAALYLATQRNETDTPVLTGTDYILGATCLVIAASEANGGDISTLTAGQVGDAITFATNGRDSLPTDDPAWEILDQMLTALSNFN